MPYFLILALSIFAYVTLEDTGGAEQREKIAIVDTGIIITPEIKPYLCNEIKDATGTGIVDRNGHGTNIANIIKTGMDPKKQCLFIVKYYDKGSGPDDYFEALSLVLKEKGVKYLNLSLNGSFPDSLEREALQVLLNRGVKISVAAGNSKEYLSYGCHSYPSCYDFNHKNFHVVGGTGVSASNFGPVVNYWEDGYRISAGGITMSGTSQACAVHTSKLIRKEK